MKKLYPFLFFAILIVLIARCNNCSDVACFTPPQPFIFNFVDSNDVNVFASERYTTNELSIKDNNTETCINYEVIDTHLIQINSIGWATEMADYTLNLGQETDINITATTLEVNQDCCTFFNMTDFDVKDRMYSISDSGVIIVRL